MKSISVRYSVVFLLMFVTTIFFGGRSILSISGGDLSKDLQLSTVQLGYLFSSFSVTYVLFQIPCGLLLDKIKTKFLYLFFLIFWSVVSLGTFFVTFIPNSFFIFPALIVFRLLAGLFEAPIFPANSRIVSCWFPKHEISFASAIFASSQYLSIFICSPIIAWVTYHQGWQFNFLYLGSAALLLGIVLKYWLHSPKDHPFISQTELDYLDQHLAVKTASTKVEQSSVRERITFLMTNKTMLGVCLGQYCMNAITFFFLTWFPLYLIEVKGMSLVSVGIMASIPALFGFFGNLCAGLVSDRMVKLGFSIAKARKLPIIVGMMFSTFMLFSLFTDSPILIVMFMSFAFFGKGFSSLGWTIVADIAPKPLYGLCGGIFNTAGNLSGIITPVVIAYMIEITGFFDVAVYITGLHALIAIVCFVWFVGDLDKIEYPTSPKASGYSVS
ncbi:MFS transporter [Vibrio ziniensis]|uniref:MFS transporter n=1 Tax=Vibrio ziniensis TaxID=2711221 RepID=A0A6G7CPV2_9VIBR|nr:MFS transporter [Vibrio ziniensis]